MQRSMSRCTEIINYQTQARLLLSSLMGGLIDWGWSLKGKSGFGSSGGYFGGRGVKEFGGKLGRV
jgi:hypothetical protein